MVKVLIDDVEYTPAVDMNADIGIAITTRNRPQSLAKTLEQIAKHTPADFPVIVVDDASTKPVEQADYRFDKNVGVAVAKNKCLELLMAKGVDHLFLLDDDCYPICDGWYLPYVESPEPHLMWAFDKPEGVTKPQLEVLYRDDQHVAYHATRGCALYFHRTAIEKVGGMRPEFGLGNWEHVNLSDRIHAAGLSTWRYADVIDSDQLLYSMDQHGEVKSTITAEARRYSEGPGLELRMEGRHDSSYVEYRDLDDVVITTMLSSKVDPQRGKIMPSDAKTIKALHDSLGRRKFVVLASENLKDVNVLPNADIVPVTHHINAYFERWLQIYRWLRNHPEVGRVWAVDATDVTMNRDPFPEMEDGRFYFGWEPDTLRNEWLLKNHPDADLQKFMKGNPNFPLLNMGVVGGSRETIMEFAQKLTKLYFDDEIDFIMGWQTSRLGVGDMAAGNYVARTFFGDIIDTGPHVTQVFKSNIGSAHPWWLHKAKAKA